MGESLPEAWFRFTYSIDSGNWENYTEELEVCPERAKVDDTIDFDPKEGRVFEVYFNEDKKQTVVKQYNESMPSSVAIKVLDIADNDVEKYKQVKAWWDGVKEKDSE
jgi:hypothetical protein